MVRPKMILFDYGQTLADEQKFDGAGARNAGMFPVWYTGASHSIHDNNEDQTLMISHWVELINMLMS